MNKNEKYWGLLFLLIIIEVISISLIKYSSIYNKKYIKYIGFIGFTIVGILLYNIFLLGNLVITRAIWDVLSIILLTIIAITFFNEKLDKYHFMGLIFAIIALFLVNYNDIIKIM
jgi:multidrug transporter EmrE-like cation transporter